MDSPLGSGRLKRTAGCTLARAMVAHLDCMTGDRILGIRRQGLSWADIFQSVSVSGMG